MEFCIYMRLILQICLPQLYFLYSIIEYSTKTWSQFYNRYLVFKNDKISLKIAVRYFNSEYNNKGI